LGIACCLILINQRPSRMALWRNLPRKLIAYPARFMASAGNSHDKPHSTHRHLYRWR
jgi:hypothetical protein